MSFKAKKTAMLVGLCCLGMISYRISSFRSANEAGYWSGKRLTGSADWCHGNGEGYQ